MAEKILLVENEEKLVCMVKLEFQYEGYEVEGAFDGRAGLDQVLSGEFDLVLLDTMLPVLFGMEVLHHLRRENAMPVIMPIARDTAVDKVSGLDMGADDYTTESFAVEELLAYIWAALCKCPAQAAEPLRGLPIADPLTMDTDRHGVSVSDEGVELARRELGLLYYLLENKGRITSREFLLDHVRGFDFVGETNAVDVYIRFLQAKANEHFDVKLIHAARGVGYVIREEGQ